MDRDPIDSLTNLPPDLREQIKARRASAQAEIRSHDEMRTSLFHLIDSVTIVGRTPNADMTRFSKHQNPKGDIVYLRQDSKEAYPSQDQIAALSTRIKAEEVDFKTLDSSEQAKIRKGGSPRFSSYLSNEALREQFQKIK